jgi:hypothetical protein
MIKLSKITLIRDSPLFWFLFMFQTLNRFSCSLQNEETEPSVTKATIR